MCFRKIVEPVQWNRAYDTCSKVGFDAKLVGKEKTPNEHWQFVIMYLYMTLEKMKHSWTGVCNRGREL